ncbi:hypothetical protein K1719_024390 [Acacia pycnantha]|nr:hypothetical protein K1719_024390 [Acacia pycnantha]
MVENGEVSTADKDELTVEERNLLSPPTRTSSVLVMPPGASFLLSSIRKRYDKGCRQVVGPPAHVISATESIISFLSSASTDPFLSEELWPENCFESSQAQREELKARLKKLEELAEEKAYQEIVKDIAPKKDVNEPFSSYKDQLGFELW